MKKLLFISLSFLFALTGISQEWLNNLPTNKNTEELNFYDYQKAFNEYWAPFNVDDNGYYLENGKKKKAAGWKQYHRWAWDMEGQIDPKTGAFPTKTAQEVYQEFIKAQPKQERGRSASWTPLGPNSSTGGYAGVGRINCIAFHPTDNNIYWIGAPGGGLWKTTDDGNSWICLTDDNSVLGISDILIPTDYAASQTIYIGTGDKDGWDNRSVGVLKTTDGGATWNTTGISYNLSQNEMITRLLVNPNDNQEIIAATKDGVYKTTDGGTNWATQLTNTYFMDMEYKPGDFSTLYGSTKHGDIYTSNDAGANWAKIYDNPDGRRIELAVSPDNANIVYAVVGGMDSGLLEILKSTNSGASFPVVFSGATKNLLGWDSNGGDAGGQAWYDLSMAASPVDANTILVGGVNTWRSTNGGADWSIVTHWYGASGVQAVHADKHKLEYRSNGDLFECNDGGVYFSSNDGTVFLDKTNGLMISQMYRMGATHLSYGENIAGLQDNGTKNLSGGNWSDVKGGDGMDCLIDYTDINIQYGCSQYGNLSRTTNHWNNSTGISPNGAGSGAWVTPYIIDPVNHNTLYAGYQDLWKTTDKGNNWARIYDRPSGTINFLAIAPSDNLTILVGQYGSLMKTTDGGVNWVDIAAGLPFANGSISSLHIKHDDPNTIWVSLTGYNNHNVYESTDGGGSWNNISAGLPSLPAYSVIQNTQLNNELHLYVGTEIGVYLKKGNLDWVPYNDGLPNVKSGEIEIYYDVNPGNSKLRLASYGRGMWESPLEPEETNLPTVQTSAPTNITTNSATVGGNVLSEGASNITERGVVWGLTANPTTADNKIIHASLGTGIYTSPLAGLNSATTYHTRAYAINNEGTSYGANEPLFTLCGSFNLPFSEGFESGSFPPDCWVSYRGINNIGAASDWTDNIDAYEGSKAALSNYEDVSGGLAEDWLVSPQISLASNSQLSFYQKQTYGVNYGSIYEVKISTTSQTDHNSFVNVGAWTETDFNTNYTEKIIDLSAYDGQDVYVAFVMTNDNGDDWLIDNINITGSTTTPAATVLAIPGCNTGTVKVSSSLSGLQTFYLTQDNGTVITSVTQNADFYDFTGLADGVYRGKVEKAGEMSTLSSSVSLTNNTIPTQASAISGDVNPCEGSSQTYSVSNVAGVTYAWTLPAGWTGTSTSNSITVTIGAGNGDISVIPSNACGDGAARTLGVTVEDVPAQASAITGNTNPCEGSSQTYSVTNVAGITYAWTLPAGWTGTSTSNSITVTIGAGSGDITVTPSNACGDGAVRTVAVLIDNLPSQPSAINGSANPCAGSSQTYSVTNVAGLTYAWSLPAGWTGTSTSNSITVTVSAGSGDITVTPSNACGDGTSRTMAITVEDTPTQASAISGDTNPCEGSSQTYSVSNVAGITYAWTLPAGWTGTSTSNSITVTVGVGNGDISVIPSNACGDGAARTLAVTVEDVPAQASAIAGNTNPCEGSSQTYSVSNVAGITYAWTLPAGWTGTSTSNSITATVGVGSGDITVTPSNACGDGTSRSLAVLIDNLPSQPTSISGSANPCAGSSQTYSVTNVAGITYAWTLPAGWTGTSTSNTITVTVGAGSGDITVTPSNACGDGTSRTVAITVEDTPTQASAISGDANPCESSSQTYSVTNVAGITYAWTLPAGWTGTSTSNSITVTVGVSNGDISVIPSNACGDGAARTLAVTVEDVPAQASAISGNTNPCEGSSQSYSVTNVAGITYAWTLPAGWTGSSTSNSITVTVGAGNGDITVTPSNACGDGTSRSLAVLIDNLPSHPTSISGSANPCAGSSQSYSVTNVAGITYAWTLPAGWTGTSTSNAITVTVGAGNGDITVTPSNACGDGTSRTMAITVEDTPTQASTISGDANPCEGSSQTYSVSNVAGITYAWTLPAGWTGTSTSNSITVTVGVSNGDISVIPSNACGDGAARTLAVTVEDVPAQASAITGNTNPCEGSSQTYSVSNVAGITYTWTLPAGWTGTSTSNSITVTVGAGNGDITVIPSNACGDGTSRSLAVLIDNLPSQPTSISGSANPCAGSSQTYSVSNVAGITYAWTLPAGWTGTSTSNTITVTVGAGNGDITVTPSNACGDGTSRTMAITVEDTPTQASTISGDANPCEGSSQTYSVSNVAGITYAWTLPAGWTGTSTSNSITVTVGVSNGDISVIPSNACGDGAARTLAVTVEDVPAQASAITGNTNPCEGSSQTYSVSNVAGITYTWTLPAGWTGTSTSNSITVTVGAGNGDITVTPSNACGDGTSRTLAIIVEDTPAQASIISGDANPCEGSSQTYSVTNVAGITYAWTLPAGWTGTSTSNTITVTVGAGNGDITVTPSNACGDGTSRTLAITVDNIPAQASIISGDANPCEGSSQTYSVSNIAGITYAWTLPAGWTGTSTSNSITVTVGVGNGDISVIPSNACGNGATRTLAITVEDVPAQASAITGNTNPCEGSSQTYSVTNVAGITYAWTLPAAWTGTSTSNSITVTVGVGNGDISVIPSNACGDGAARTLAVLIDNIPSQPSAISGSASPCEGSSQTYSVTNVAGITYAWTLPAGWTGTSTSNSITVTVGSINGNILVTPSNACGDGAARTLAVTVDNLPEQPSDITGNSAVCAGSTETYYVIIAPGITYTWNLPAGWTGSSTTNSITVTVGSADGDISVIPSNSCGDGIAQSLAIAVNTVPAQPSVISGEANPCEGSSQIYSVTNDADVDNYIWTLPADWTGTSTSNSITVTIGSIEGDITVAPSNICGTGTSQSLAVLISNLPAQPSVISGNDQVCEGSTEVYSVTNDPEVDSYTWTIPSGWTGSSTTNSISLVAGANGGDIMVSPTNACGSGPAQSMAIIISNTGPDQPENITGDFTTCAGANETYSVPLDPAVGTYTWTLPAGWSGTSTTNSITVTIGADGGEISVIPSNTCGDGPAQTVTAQVSATIPIQPDPIAGNEIVCFGDTEEYSVNLEEDVEYTWLLPSGWAGAGTSNVITVTVGVSSGDITVYPANGCGVGPSQSLFVEVNDIPLQPDDITGEELACEGSSQTYTVTPEAGLSYEWTIPADWTGTSTTNSITVTVGSLDGEVSVLASNMCGDSPLQTLAVETIHTLGDPGEISGIVNLCSGDQGIEYSITEMEDAETYNWTVPANASIISGAGTAQIIVDFSEDAESGDISVQVENICGESSISVLEIEIGQTPDAPSAINGPTAVMETLTETYEISDVSGVNSYIWTLDPTWILNSGAGTTQVSITFPMDANSGVLSVASQNDCGTSEMSNLDIEILPIGINENLQNSNMTLYPNPSKGRVTIDLVQETKYVTIVKVLSLSGELVSDLEIETGLKEMQLDMSVLAPGSYIIDLENPLFKKQFKIVIVK